MRFSLLSRPPVRCIRDVRAFEPTWNSCALTIGSFRSLHAGHCHLVATTAEWAGEASEPTAVLSFHPTAHEVISARRLPKLLNSATRRLLLASWGVDCYIEHRLDRAFLAMEAEEFVERVILGKLRARRLIVGDDFRFGHKRRGDFDLLKRYERAGDLIVSRIASVASGEERISTTRVDRIVDSEDYAGLRSLLGRPWSYVGRVQAGRGEGRKLGSPTLNIPVAKEMRTPLGVFAGLIELPDHTPYQAAVNIGTRPTFTSSSRRYIEAHLLDKRPDRAGRIAVHLLHRIRSERSFGSPGELQEQIASDIKEIRAYFAGAEPGRC